MIDIDELLRDIVPGLPVTEFPFPVYLGGSRKRAQLSKGSEWEVRVKVGRAVKGEQ
jgi:hypothetical protein